MDRGAWQATVPRVSKSQTWLKQLSMHGRLSQCTPLLNCAHWVKLLSADKTQFHPMVLLLQWGQKNLLMTVVQLYEDTSLSSYETSSCVKSTSLTHLVTSHSSPFSFPWYPLPWFTPSFPGDFSASSFTSCNPFFFFFFSNFIFKLYIIVLVLPNIKMNPPQVYMCSPSRTRS